MPVPFRDDEEIKALGLAAYLKIERNASGFLGALFVVNARGEPVEFTYTRVEIPHTFLWREADIRHHAARQIAASLFATCPQTPSLLLCLAEEIDSETFCHDISVPVAVCRVAPAGADLSHEPGEQRQEALSSEAWQLFWFPASPTEGSNEHNLFKRLSAWGLLAEPFERAKTGLRTVYDD